MPRQHLMRIFVHSGELIARQRSRVPARSDSPRPHWTARHDRLVGVAQWSTAVVAFVTVMLSLFAVIPPHALFMLVLRIAATEGCFWLEAIAVTTLVLMLIPVPRSRLRISTALMALATGVIALHPLWSISSASTHADAALTTACGSAWLDRIPQATRSTMRPRPVTVRESIEGVNPGSVIETRLGIPASSGEHLAAMRYQPAHAGPGLPVVVALHGGGWRGGSIEEGAFCNRYLAGHGYLVYSIDYRNAPATRFPGQLHDVEAALAWISIHAGESGGDASRLILLGRSAGAELALIAAYAHPNPSIRAVVSWYGPVDLDGGYREPPHPDPLRVRTLIGAFLGGTPDREPERYARASPITYALRPLPPTLLIAGGDDHGVTIAFQRRMRDRLASTGTPVALVELPWAEHAFDRVARGPGAQISLYYLERFLAWAVTDNSQPSQAQR